METTAVGEGCFCTVLQPPLICNCRSITPRPLVLYSDLLTVFTTGGGRPSNAVHEVWSPGAQSRVQKGEEWITEQKKDIQDSNLSVTIQHWLLGYFLIRITKKEHIITTCSHRTKEPFDANHIHMTGSQWCFKKLIKYWWNINNALGSRNICNQFSAVIT